MIKYPLIFFTVLIAGISPFVVLLKGASATIAPKKQHVAPNIIIILADDLGWGDVGYHGSSIKTPYIDRLSREGIVLNRFYTAAICSPTRAGLLTGRYPDRYGLRSTVIPPWSQFGVDTSEVFLPQLLANVGYRHRAILGKWHLGHASRQYQPLSRGFTHFYGHLNGAIDYFTHEREGELDWHRDLEPSHDKGYATDLIAQEAIKNITTYSSESPFFLYIAFNAPHSPLQAKKEDLLRYGYDENKPGFNQVLGNSSQGRGNTKRQTYEAMVSNLDSNIGRILQTLENLKIADNTIVLFASDNGAAPGEAGSSGVLRGTKFTEWEGGVRAPAIIKWPDGFKGGYTSNQVMGFIDILPTMLAAAGAKVTHKKPLDGINVLPVLKDSSQQIDRSFFLGAGAIVSQDWKLIEASDENPRMKLPEDQFFQIEKDSIEANNVSKEAALQYKALKHALSPYKAITADETVPAYEQGRKGFIAPKNWQLKD
jgi:arylsulfatase B